MLKQLFLAATLLCTYTLNAQQSFEWPYEDKEAFLASCRANTGDEITKENARQYCYCMLYKLQASFESPEDVTASVLQEPKWQREVKECLEKNWDEAYRSIFLNSCLEEAKKNFSEEKAVSYCECMLFKIETYYEDPEEFPSEGLDDLFTTPYWNKEIKDCLGL